LLITGEDRMKADVQRTPRDLHDLARETEDGIPPAIVTGQLIRPPSCRHKQIPGKHEVYIESRSPLPI
jgi:hypothetical protein